MASKKVGALWLKASQNGQKYFSGQLDLGALGTVNIAVFKNDRKEQENHPDYNIMLSERKQNSAPAAQAQPSFAPREDEVQVDDLSQIPF